LTSAGRWTSRHREQQPRLLGETPDAEVGDATGNLQAIEAILD
jgi:hypothetical protein